MFNNSVFCNSIRTIIMSITTSWGNKTMLLIFDGFKTLNDVSSFVVSNSVRCWYFAGGVLPITIGSTIDRITLAGDSVGPSVAW